MAGYIGNEPLNEATQTRESFTATSGQTSFATSGYTPGYLDVYFNGVHLETTDYTATNGTDVVLDTAAAADDILTIVAWKVFNPTQVSVSDITDLTATAAEINTLDGITATTTELNYTDGVTSSIQTQLDAKAPLASPTLTGTPLAPTATAGTNTTQIATTAFVGTAVSNLVDSAPAALDTLNELAAALGDDANFSTTVTNSLATKLPLAGGTMTGAITFAAGQTFDGRDVSADGSKLDGIESGATADQTAQEIATAIDADATAEATLKSALGLGTAAYTASTDYATAAQGTTADAALPKAGGTMTGNLNFGDNVKAQFGAGSDLQIYHDGSHSYLRDLGTGNLFLDASHLYIRDSDGYQYISCLDNGSGGTVTLKHNDSAKLATTSTGIDVTGTVTSDGLDMDDGAYIKLGTSDDLEIYHDGGNSWIRDVGTGYLYLDTNGSAIRLVSDGSAAGGTMGEFVRDGAVTLYYDNSAKIATTSSGVSVTGTCAATAFTGDGSGLTGVEAFPSGTAMLFAQTSAPTGWTKSTTHNDKALRVVSGTASSGGSSAFSTALGTPSVSGTVSLSGAPAAGNLAVSVSGSISNTTLTTSTMPKHRHGAGAQYANEAMTGDGVNKGWQSSSTTTTGWAGNVANTNAAIDTAGTSGAHSHSHTLSGTMNGAPSIGNLAASLSSSTAAINVQYVDVIIATKN